MIISEEPYIWDRNRKLVEFHDDVVKYPILKSQKWIPKAIPFKDHPAKVGDIVTLSNHAAEYCGFKIGIVGQIRLFKQNSTNDCNTYYQVELLGVPRKWFETGHFLEYRKKDGEKYDYRKHGFQAHTEGGCIVSGCYSLEEY